MRLPPSNPPTMARAYGHQLNRVTVPMALTQIFSEWQLVRYARCKGEAFGTQLVLQIRVSSPNASPLLKEGPGTLMCMTIRAAVAPTCSEAAFLARPSGRQQAQA